LRSPSEQEPNLTALAPNTNTAKLRIDNNLTHSDKITANAIYAYYRILKEQNINNKLNFRGGWRMAATDFKDYYTILGVSRLPLLMKLNRLSQTSTQIPFRREPRQ